MQGVVKQSIAKSSTTPQRPVKRLQELALDREKLLKYAANEVVNDIRDIMRTL